MTQFDWQTEEDDWEDGPDTAVTDASSSRKNWRKISLITLGLLGLFIFSAAVLFWQVQRRTEAATDNLTEGLLATHALLQKSALSADSDLFQLALFPATEWREVQEALLARQLLWNRSSLGLWLDLESFDPEDTSLVDIDYAPDLQSAEVTAVLPYVFMDEDGVLAPMALQRTAFYRQLNGGWLYAPFPVDFWGEAVEINGRNFTVEVPARDAEIAARLAQDLDDLVDEACGLSILICSAGLQAEINFLIEPESAFIFNRNFQSRSIYRADTGRILQINLPTPTLIGLPVDEIGYQALYRGYAAQLIARLSAYLSSELDLHPPLLQALDLNLPHPVSFHPQSELIATPIPFPQEKIVAVCAENSPTDVFRYDPNVMLWSKEYDIEGDYINGMTSAVGHGIFLASGDFAADQYVLEWVVNGESTIIDVGQNSFSIGGAFEHWEDDSQAIAMIYYENSNNVWGEHLLKMDPASCANSDGCYFEHLDYFPVFSPERTRSMVRVIGERAFFDGFEFWLGDASGQPIAEAGRMYTPNWINEDTILFTKVNDSESALRDVSLLKVDVSDGEFHLDNAETILTSEVVNEFVAQDDVFERFSIGAILTPYNEAVGDVVPIFVIKVEGADAYMSGYLLEYDLEGGTLSWMEPFAEVSLMANVTYSPDNRFLQAMELKENRETLHLLDRETGELQSHHISNVAEFKRVSWSQDENWLVVPGDEALHLIAPSAKYERLVFYEEGKCNTAVWVNKNNQ